MPDNDDTTGTTVADGAVETPTPESVQTPAPDGDASAAHPLEPGGERFEQVYARLKTLERLADDRLTRITELEAKTAPKEAAPAVQVYTPDQLQTAVDQGRITQAQASAQLALQAKEQAKSEMRAETQRENLRLSAAREVDQFIDKKPDLLDPSSESFRRVARVAREIASEMGTDVNDPRVQRRALRETFGTLDRVQQTRQTQAHDRRSGDIYAETGRGGGAQPPEKASPALKNVPREWVDYWRPRVANEKELENLAKHYRPTRKFTARV